MNSIRIDRTRRLGVALLAGLAVSLAACTDKNVSGDDTSIAVSSTADACTVSVTSVPAGNVVFEVTNDGSEVTEFYLLGSDGESVVGEVENIGPGLTRSLAVEVAEGEYFTQCKPGMKGEGIRASFVVEAE